MKTIALIFGLLLTQLSFGQTKEKKTPEQRADLLTNKLDSIVKLTSEQKSKIYNLNLETAKKNQTIAQKKDLTKEQKKEQIKANNKSRQTAVKEILTEQQRNIIKEKHKAKKEHKARQKELEQEDEF